MRSFSTKRQFSGKSGGSKRPVFHSGSRRSFGGSRGGRRVHKSGYIDPARFVNKADASKVEVEFRPKHSFENFAFSKRLKDNLEEKGYTSPTPIQDEAILPISQGRDFIGLANTGTGKTAAFLLPILEQLQQSQAREAVLIIAPTRELAVQIADEFRGFAKGLNLTCTVVVGGAPMKRQVLALKRQPNVIIGTPGRLKDLANQKKLFLGNVKHFVLDEADHMMDMGFLPDIKFLIGLLPKQRQSLCFTATLPSEIDKLMRELLRDPISVSVLKGNTSDNVDQDVLYANSAPEKIAKLVDLMSQEEFSRVLVFGKTKHGVQRLSDTLRKEGIRAEAIHGNKSQMQRQKALSNFKEGKATVLVATDVAARGIDVPNVSHVINFDQPNSFEDYIHRIGRTGRAGKLGKALTFVQGGSRF